VQDSDKKDKRASMKSPKRITVEEPSPTPPRSESPGPAADEELKAKQRKLLAREEELIHREQDLNRKATELEALKAREKELQDKLTQFETDQVKLRALVEEHNADVLGGAMPLISASEVKLKNKVGEGAFAEILRGEWRGLAVAVKKAFKPDEGPIAGKYAEADIADIFFREVKIMSKLHHPNIVMVMAACVEPENRLFIMELCHTDLFAYLHSGEEIQVKDRLEMAIGAASALFFLHSFKPALLHRDIKSSNFLVDFMGNVKLTDFGLCATKGSDHSFGFTTQSADDAHKGTPAYMAPECLKTESFDEKSDVWSFGVVLWELITRQIPWEGLEPTRIYAEVTTGNRLKVPDNSGFPADYVTLMRSCWLDHPKDRPSFREILKKLRSIKKSLKK
jgi:serine/threonine protein kinase